MGLVNLLGLRYLWVDRLCIVQDDLANKTAQINSMGYIYGGAYLTIVANAGYDANHGLKGIRGISAAKAESDFSIEKRQNANAKDVLHGQSRQRHHHLVAQSTWNERGWTLQELVFSPRALFYHENTVTWECHCAIWHEKATFDSENDSCLVRFNPQAWGHDAITILSEWLHFWPSRAVFRRCAALAIRDFRTWYGDILPDHDWRHDTLCDQTAQLVLDGLAWRKTSFRSECVVQRIWVYPNDEKTDGQDKSKGQNQYANYSDLRLVCQNP
jgi:hypothetical protein